MTRGDWIGSANDAAERADVLAERPRAPLWYLAREADGTVLVRVVEPAVLRELCTSECAGEESL